MINASANGIMDLKNTNYPRVEHYYSRCNLTEGNYTIKVSLFSGSASARSPLMFYVTLVAGEDVLVTGVKLTDAYGSG